MIRITVHTSWFPVLLCGLITAAAAADSPIEQTVAEARAQLERYEQDFSAGPYALDELAEADKKVRGFDSLAHDCIQKHESELASITSRLHSQGPRGNVQQAHEQRAVIGKQLAACEALRDHSNSLMAELGLLIRLETVKDYKRRFTDRPEQRQDIIDQQQYVSESRRFAFTCINEVGLDLQGLNKELDVLGPASEGDTLSLTETRQTLEANREALEKKLSNCKVLLVESESLLNQVEQLQGKELEERLKTRATSIISLLLTRNVFSNWIEAIRGLGLKRSGLEYLTAISSTALMALTVILLAAGIYLRSKLRASTKPMPPAEDGQDLWAAMGVAFSSTLQRYLPALVLFAGGSCFWVVTVWQDRPWPSLAVINFAITAYIVALTVGRALFSPVPPGQHYLPIDETSSKSFWRAFNLTLLVITIGASVFLSPFEEGLTEPLLVAARAGFVTVLVIGLIRTVWLAFTLGRIQRIGLFRPLVTFALFCGLVAEWLGYHQAAKYIVGGIAFSLGGFGIAWLLSKLLGDFIDGLDGGRYQWERRLRSQMAIEPDKSLPGLIWLRLLGAIVIWGGLIMFLLRIWGLSAKGQEVIIRYVTEGFQAGPVSIVPIKLAYALLLFSLLLSAVSWLKNQLDRRWLRKTRLDHGAREATVTVSGYVGIALAGLVSLGVAGVDFSNLAIIAGALSVGIGFGLQNVVNNFVSGLILLFERPIRTGDWVVAGTTEGFVKRISIRSTQIQTFDRADVIVPNSQLIADQVTNWTLRDMRGRIRIPVSVAYGSDAARVREILLSLANECPSAITNGSLPQPQVLFVGFGDSALNFELRFFVSQIDRLFLVTSDINFAIDAAFREAGIEIPFPQRDIHIRSQPTDSTAAPGRDSDKEGGDGG
ncbi:MAG: mechanosensitive ion channel domain-containing protein [Gammaproteobacteria bacterium]